MRSALIDAGPLFALFDPRDAHHARYAGLVLSNPASFNLHSTWPCVVEACDMLGAPRRFRLLEWIALGGVQIFPFESQHLLDMLGWMERYTEPRKSEMDFADASLYWLANESGVTTVLTVDKADFSRYRLPDGQAFEIL